MSQVTERCGCGAEIAASGVTADLLLRDFRKAHEACRGRVCPQCNGTGKPPTGWLAARACPTCKGSGRVPARGSR